LLGGKVTIFGAGGITQELIKLLAPFDCEITVIRRTANPLAGANRTLALADRLHGLAGADLVVLALALTDATQGVIGEAELAAMADHGWLVNVARGRHVQVDPLLAALRAGTIGGAALDVTDPEPLPDGHDLWNEPRVIITPHIGNTPEMGVPLLADHVRANVANFQAGRKLEGLVSITAGY
jgi:phosphoglycerate dehydrogenase-like enzyme